jgi:hypothetical protein
VSKTRDVLTPSPKANNYVEAAAELDPSLHYAFFETTFHHAVVQHP